MARRRRTRWPYRHYWRPATSRSWIATATNLTTTEWCLAGAQPLYVEAFPMTEYSMYGAVPLRTIKQALLNLKADGRLHRAKMVDLTNCTFDGHIYNTRRVMEECLAIKPDLIFLWDEAWFGFARFSPFLRPRTAMGAAHDIEAWLHDPNSVAEYEKQQAELGANPSDEHLAEQAADSGSTQSQAAGLSDELHSQVHVCFAAGLDAARKGCGVPYCGGTIPRGSIHPCLHQPKPAVDRQPGRGTSADGIGGLRPRAQRDRGVTGDTTGGRQASLDFQVFSHSGRRQDGPGCVSPERFHRLPGPQSQLGCGAPQHPRG